VFGPLEVFGDANRSRSDGPTYEINIISGGTDRDVLTHIGTTLRTDRTYDEQRGPVDTLLVAGSMTKFESNVSFNMDPRESALVFASRLDPATNRDHTPKWKWRSGGGCSGMLSAGTRASRMEPLGALKKG